MVQTRKDILMHIIFFQDAIGNYECNFFSNQTLSQRNGLVVEVKIISSAYFLDQRTKYNGLEF